jgi:CRISPR/Cas system-associated exonuclease Cas4 (RecB family)
MTFFVGASAEERLQAALAFLADRSPAEEVLVLGPSRGAMDELAFAHARASGATFGVHRKTLAGLAAELAAPALAAQDVALAAPLATLAIAQDVVRRALAEGSIPLLSRRPPDVMQSAAESPGFAAALLRTIDELRLGAVEPERLVSIGGQTAEVGALALAYRRELEARGLADRARVLEAATSVASASPFSAMPVLVLDVPIRHRREARFVETLLALDRAVLVLVPEGDRATRRHLEAMGRLGPAQLGASPRPASAIESFRARLSDEDAAVELSNDDTVTMFAAPGEAIEAVEIARAILADARRGVPFEQVAIALRAREAYATHVEAALHRAGIPAYFEGGSRRPHPSGRALALLLACKVERGSGRRLAEYLATAELPRVARTAPEPTLPATEDLGRFGDGAPIDEDTPDEPSDRQIERPSLRRWERLLGEAGVTLAGSSVSLSEYVARRLRSTRTILEDTLVALPEEGASARSRAERDASALADLEACLAPVLQALDAIPLAGSWRQMLDALRQVASVSVRRPELVLSVLAELEPLTRGDEPVDLQVVRSVVEPRLVSIERPPPASPRGRVLVTTPSGLRGRARDVVHVPGLAERVFPERTYEDPLLVDEVRRVIDEALPTQADRAAQEREQLLVASGAATTRLRFSYPRLDVDADRARVPSLFGLEVARAALGVLPDLEAIEASAQNAEGASLAWPAPRDPALAIDSVEEELAFVGELLAAPASASGRARFLLAFHPHVRSALAMRWRRHHHKRLGSADGLYPTRAATKHFLALHRLTASPVSASLLQAFAACPYRYYLQSIVGLSARTDAVPVERLDPATLGALHHQCQAELARRLSAAGISPSDAAHVEEVRAIASSVVRELAEKERERLEPLLPAVFDRDVARVERDLLGALAVDAEKNDGFVPLFAELGFGLSRPGLDQRSVPEPVRLRGGFLLRGAIDRVDRRPDGVVRVTDFKTGRLPQDIKGFLATGGGKLNQPLLYALALEALSARLLAPGDTVGRARFFFSTERAGFETKEVELTDDNKARGIRILEIVDRAVDRGIFFARPQKDACKGCDYREVCGPDEERRAHWKKPEGLAERALDHDLVALRGMP